MKFPIRSGKNPTQSDKHHILKPHTAAWLLVLTVFTGAVAYAADGGIITLNGATSGTVTVQVPAVAGATTFQLPGSNGTSGFVLSTDGTGVTSWVSNAGTASTALSGITVASAAHTINNVNWAQTWNWNSLTTQTAFTFASSSLTNGAIVSIQNTAVSATSTGKVLSISDATTGSGYGVYSSMTGHGNTGYAGYFTNTDTSTNQNYGVYALVNSTSTSNSIGVYGAASGCASCYGVYGSSGNIGVYGGGNNYGVWATSPNTNAGYGIYALESGSANTGYAGFFQNTSTSGFAGYFTNTATTGGPAGIVSIYSNNWPAGADMLDVGTSNGTALGVDQWSNVYFENAIYYMGYDHTFAVTAFSTNSVPLYMTTDGASGSNDNIIIEPNGTGKVGIGTTSPGHKLEAFASTTTVSSDATYPFFADTAGYGVVLGGDSTNQNGVISAVKTLTSWQNLEINPNGGNVGIGTTAPANLLSLYGTSNGGNLLTITNPTTNSYSTMQFVGTGDTYVVGVGNASETFYGVANKFMIYDQNAFLPRLVVDSSGNVGIGTTSPTAPLDVNGTIRARSDSYVSSDFTKTSSAALAAITGLTSGTLMAGKAYAFDIWLFTTSGTSGGIKVDLNGGSATATTIIGEAQEWDGTAIGVRTRIAALSTGLCGITAVSTAACHITGTIIVNVGGTFIPEFAQNASNGTASVVKTGSFMTIRQLN
jgi:hypothetical protein